MTRHCAPECKLRVEARVSIRKAASAVRARTPMKLQTFFSLVGYDLISLILEHDLVRKVCNFSGSCSKTINHPLTWNDCDG